MRVLPCVVRVQGLAGGLGFTSQSARLVQERMSTRQLEGGKRGGRQANGNTLPTMTTNRSGS